MSLMSLTALELGKKIQAKEVSAVEAAKEALGQIKKLDGSLNCFVTVEEDSVLKKSRGSTEKDRCRRACRPAGRRPGGNQG